MAAVETGITVEFEPEKETKGTWKFQEVTPGEFAEPKIGSLYVRKNTLGELGYQAGSKLRVTVEVIS